MHTPPRSPGGDKLLGKTFSPKLSGVSLFDIKSSPKELHASDDLSFTKQSSKLLEVREEKFNPLWSKTEGALLVKAFNEGSPNLITVTQDKS